MLDQTDGFPVWKEGRRISLYNEDNKESAVAGRFVVVRDGEAGYRLRIEAEDGQLMATSEP